MMVLTDLAVQRTAGVFSKYVTRMFPKRYPQFSLSFSTPMLPHCCVACDSFESFFWTQGYGLYGHVLK